jgi:hypothetical protein
MCLLRFGQSEIHVRTMAAAVTNLKTPAEVIDRALWTRAWGIAIWGTFLVATSVVILVAVIASVGWALPVGFGGFYPAGVTIDSISRMRHERVCVGALLVYISHMRTSPGCCAWRVCYCSWLWQAAALVVIVHVKYELRCCMCVCVCPFHPLPSILVFPLLVLLVQYLHDEMYKLNYNDLLDLLRPFESDSYQYWTEQRDAHNGMYVCLDIVCVESNVHSVAHDWERASLHVRVFVKFSSDRDLTSCHPPPLTHTPTHAV